MACPNEGCGQSFTVSALEEHKIECGYRLISCDHCSATIRFNIISVSISETGEKMKYVRRILVEYITYLVDFGCPESNIYCL